MLEQFELFEQTFEPKPDDIINPFDLEKGEKLRDAAIKQVGDNASSKWLEAALAAVQRVAEANDEFTTDEVWAEVAEMTHEPRAMGAVMRIAVRKKLVIPTNQYQPTKRPSSHARPIRVWKSLI